MRSENSHYREFLFSLGQRDGLPFYLEAFFQYKAVVTHTFPCRWIPITYNQFLGKEGYQPESEIPFLLWTEKQPHYPLGWGSFVLQFKWKDFSGVTQQSMEASLCAEVGSNKQSNHTSILLTNKFILISSWDLIIPFSIPFLNYKTFFLLKSQVFLKQIHPHFKHKHTLLKNQCIYKREVLVLKMQVLSSISLLPKLLAISETTLNKYPNKPEISDSIYLAIILHCHLPLLLKLQPQISNWIHDMFFTFVTVRLCKPRRYYPKGVLWRTQTCSAFMPSHTTKLIWLVKYVKQHIPHQFQLVCIISQICSPGIIMLWEHNNIFFEHQSFHGQTI